MQSFHSLFKEILGCQPLLREFLLRIGFELGVYLAWAPRRDLHEHLARHSYFYNGGRLHIAQDTISL